MHPARVKRATSRYRIDQGFGQAFTINKQSPQAKGLVFWLPFTDIRGQAKHIDLVSGLVLSEGGTPVWINDSERGWVMEFDSGSNEYLRVASAPVTTFPVTLAAWVKTSATAFQGILNVTHADNLNGFYILTNNGGFVQSTLYQFGWASVATTVQHSTTDWFHVCGTFVSGADVDIYLEGGNNVNGSPGGVPAGISTTSIGNRPVAGDPMEGEITDCRIYNRALSDQEVYELYKNPWDLYKVREPQVWVRAPSIISGEVVWGHDTGVLEANVRDFTGNWTGTGAIAGAGDAEVLELETTEYMIGEVVNTGVRTVQLLQNEYDPSGDDVDMDYRHGATEAACLAAGWNNYVGTFVSLGYVQVRTTSTL